MESPTTYAEGTLDSIAAAEKSTAKSEDSQPKQAQPNVEQNVVNTEQPEIIDIDLSNPELHKAASTIQAQFRTHRKREEAKRNQKEEQPEAVDKNEPSGQTSEILPDIDLDDPELNKAASVIQSNFRTHLSKKNKATEQVETQEESEGAGGDTEPPTSRTEDSDLTKAESTMDKVAPETEESNTDDQVAPPTEVQEEPRDKEDVAENDPEPSTSESQEKVEQEAAGDKEEAPSQPAVDEEQPVETKGEDASKETETQAGGGDSEKLPEKVEESKNDGGSIDDGNGAGGSEVEPTEGTATENVEQAEATDGGENQEAPEVCSVSSHCISVIIIGYYCYDLY